MPKYSSPLQRYPGSKRGYIDRLWDGQYREALIEPFCGAAWYTLERSSSILPPGSISLADADASVQCIFKVWIEERLEDAVYEEIAYWKKKFNELAPDKAWSDLTHDYAWYSHAHKSRVRDAVETDLTDRQIAKLAATGLVMRKLTFGGVMRTGAAGKINVRYVKGQLEQLERWEYKFPPLPDAKFYFARSWEEVMEGFSGFDVSSAEAFLDPPYYAPKTDGRRCTPAYIGHAPHAPETLALCTESFESCLKDPRITRINVTNYYSEELDHALIDLCGRHGCKVSLSRGGELKGMNKVGKEKLGETEGLWTVRR